ncbi:signal recognition particle subunit SRP72 isoform X2 [Phymastichus coffea]|nr:signal recognition particle subunit SRP72 isoform X2 [Phymastichus coffea]
MAGKDSLYSLFGELYRQGQNGQYESAVKTANKILGLSQDDESALHCKVISFIQLSKFNDALQIINKYPKLLTKLEFEKAYCLYRLNQVLDAFKIIDSIPNPSLKIKELKAQILYRLERYEDCFAVYRDIIKNSTDEYEDEREANLAAVLVHLAQEKSKTEVPVLREVTYELMYNSACLIIASDSEDKANLLKAEKKLRAAEKMCRDSFEEEMTEEAIEDEIGIIKVQLGYCLQLQGREKEAQVLYASAVKKRPDDIALAAVANNNIATLNKDQNVFDSKKRMKSATQDGLEHKLTSRQRKSIAYNQCLLALYTNQSEQCQSLCKKLMKEYPEVTKKAATVLAVQLAKEGKAKEAVKLLEKQAEGEHYLPIKLACVQLLLSNEEKEEAIKVLENLNETTKSLPGIVSALVTLHMVSGNRDKASAVLKNAVNYYKKNKENTGNLGKLWRQAADFHLRGGEVAVAAASLEELLAATPSDTKTLAQLIVAYAQYDPAKAQSLSKRLPSLKDLTESTDVVDALESSNWVIGMKVVKKKVEPSPGKPEALDKKRKKRKRKGKLPKNYDATVGPDPERWLPKHERSGFRKKRDRRNRDATMKGTQGAATGAADQFDITKMSNAKPSPNPRQSPAAESSGPRQQQRKVQQKKKKKGGK